MNIFKRTGIALLVAAGLITGGTAIANATPGKYTYGGSVSIILVVTDGGCATAYYPKGGSDPFCGSMTFRQGPIDPGDKFGANVVSYGGYSVACRVIDNSTGDYIKSDFGYAGGAAVCMSRAV